MAETRVTHTELVILALADGPLTAGDIERRTGLTGKQVHHVLAASHAIRRARRNRSVKMLGLPEMHTATIPAAAMYELVR